MSMPFSSEEQIRKANDFLYGVKTPECPGCARGVRMCYHTPCIGTVDDIEKMIDAGYAKNLMLDWWNGTEGGKNDNPFTEDVMYLVPAIVGLEGKQAPFARTGKCSLLVDNKCSLHELNLKPIQGRTACCKIERRYLDNGKSRDIDERIPILHTWNTQRGVDLIERWKREVGFDQEVEESKPPESLFDMLGIIENVMDSMEAMRSDKGVDGRPDVDFSEEIQVEVEIHEKPY